MFPLTYSFTFGGINMRNYGLYLKSRVMPTLPRTREKTIEVPGRDGKLDMGAEFAERVIPLPCVIQVSNDAEFISLVRTLARIFDPTRGAQRLILDEEKDKYYMARYAGKLDIEQVLQWSEFELPMVCYDPFAYSTVSNELNASINMPVSTFEISREVNAYAVAPIIRIKNVGTTPVSGLEIKRTTNL